MTKRRTLATKPPAKKQKRLVDDPQTWTMSELREYLTNEGLKTTGSKETILERVEESLFALSEPVVALPTRKSSRKKKSITYKSSSEEEPSEGSQEEVNDQKPVDSLKANEHNFITKLLSADSVQKAREEWENSGKKASYELYQSLHDELFSSFGSEDDESFSRGNSPKLARTIWGIDWNVQETKQRVYFYDAPKSLFEEICASGNLDAVKLLLDIGGTELVQHRVAGVGMIQAIVYKKPDIVFWLIDIGVNVNVYSLDDDYGECPLSFACDSGDLEIVKGLISKGANVKEGSPDYNYQPIYYAGLKLDILKELVKAGGIELIFVQTNCPDIPLQDVISAGREDILEFFSEELEKVDSLDEEFFDDYPDYQLIHMPEEISKDVRKRFFLALAKKADYSDDSLFRGTVADCSLELSDVIELKDKYPNIVFPTKQKSARK